MSFWLGKSEMLMQFWMVFPWVLDVDQIWYVCGQFVIHDLRTISCFLSFPNWVGEILCCSPEARFLSSLQLVFPGTAAAYSFYKWISIFKSHDSVFYLLTGSGSWHSSVPPQPVFFIMQPYNHFSWIQSLKIFRQ